jgi:hypothetical protein
MRVVTVVKAIPGVDTAAARRPMAAAGVDARRRVGGLTAGQRERLAAAAVTAVPVTAPAARQQPCEASPAAVPSPSRDRAAAAGLPPGNAKTPAPENAGDDGSQIARDRGLRVSREDIQAALLEQAAREKPLSHNAIARRLGTQRETALSTGHALISRLIRH